jgi:RHS repeat-associated protein
MATRVTNYLTANGQIRGERTAGFPGHDYIPDGSGSVTATASPTTQELQFYARYFPYGRGYSVSTTNTMPAFRWLGSLGYRWTGRWHADEHVRARHFSLPDGRWTTVDPLWPQQSAYGYVSGRPVGYVDQSGTAPSKGGSCTDTDALRMVSAVAPVGVRFGAAQQTSGFFAPPRLGNADASGGLHLGFCPAGAWIECTETCISHRRFICGCQVWIYNGVVVGIICACCKFVLHIGMPP